MDSLQKIYLEPQMPNLDEKTDSDEQDKDAEITRLEEEVKNLKKDKKMYMDLYSEYLEKTVKYRAGFELLLDEIKKK